MQLNKWSVSRTTISFISLEFNKGPIRVRNHTLKCLPVSITIMPHSLFDNFFFWHLGVQFAKNDFVIAYTWNDIALCLGRKGRDPTSAPHTLVRSQIAVISYPSLFCVKIFPPEQCEKRTATISWDVRPSPPQGLPDTHYHVCASLSSRCQPPRNLSWVVGPSKISTFCHAWCVRLPKSLSCSSKLPMWDTCNAISVRPWLAMPPLWQPSLRPTRAMTVDSFKNFSFKHNTFVFS